MWHNWSVAYSNLRHSLYLSCCILGSLMFWGFFCASLHCCSLLISMPVCIQPTHSIIHIKQHAVGILHGNIFIGWKPLSTVGKYLCKQAQMWCYELSISGRYHVAPVKDSSPTNSSSISITQLLQGTKKTDWHQYQNWARDKGQLNAWRSSK